MTRIELLNSVYDEAYKLYEAGILPYQPLIWKMIYDRHSILVKTFQRDPIKQLHQEFGYTRTHIHHIINKMNESV